MWSGVAHFKNPPCWKSKKKTDTINQQHGQQGRWTVDPHRCAGATQPVGLPHFGWEHLDRMDWWSQVRHHVPRQRYIHGGFRTFKFRQGRFHVWRRSFLDCRLCQKDKPQVTSGFGSSSIELTVACFPTHPNMLFLPANACIESWIRPNDTHSPTQTNAGTVAFLR